jgi:hypothetical protein
MRCILEEVVRPETSFSKWNEWNSYLRGGGESYLVFKSGVEGVDVVAILA